MDNQEFMQKHPEVRVVPLISLFCFCQRRRASSLQEAYDHIYGESGCPFCKPRVEKDKELSQMASVKEMVANNY